MSEHSERALVVLADAAEGLRSYFHGGGFSGADWDRWPSDDSATITRVDIASLALLSTSVGEKLMTSDLVGIEVPDVGDNDLRSVERPSEGDGPWAPMYEAWGRVRAVSGVGRVKASKLLARKRPNLIPMWDKRVRRSLWGFEKNSAEAQRFDDWQAMWDLMHDPQVTDRVEQLRADAGLGADISPLRIVDVAVWMNDRRS